MKKNKSIILILLSLLMIILTNGCSSSMYQLISENKYEDIKSRIENGIDINSTIEKENITPLSLAVRNNNMKMVEFLLENGSVINSPNNLPLIALSKSYEMLKYLLSKGYDTNLIEGRQLLDKVLELKNNSIIELFNERGYDKSFIKNNPVLLEEAIKHNNSVYFNYLLQNGATLIFPRDNILLKSAIENSNISVVEILLKNGGNPNWKGIKSIESYPITESNYKKFIVKFAKYDLGCDVQSPTGKKTYIMMSKNEVYESADFNVRIINIVSPWLYSVKYGNIEMLDLMLKFGADINSIDYYQQNALVISILNKKRDIAKYLIKNNISSNTKFLLILPQNNDLKILEDVTLKDLNNSYYDEELKKVLFAK